MSDYESDAPPPARHTLKICRALQCRLNHSDELILAAEKELQLCRGETSADGRFHLEVIHCFGQCTMGPNVALDNRVYNHVTPEQLVGMIQKVGE